MIQLRSYTKTFLLLFTFVLGGLFYSNSANAADDIAIINIKTIVENSSAAQDVAKQIEEKRKEFQEIVNDEEEELRDKDQDLSKQRAVLSKEAFDQKAKDFRSEVVEAQRKVQARRTALENAYVKAMKKIREKVVAIVEELAKDEGFKVAMPRAQVLYADDSLDISEDVLEELNDQLPEINIVIHDNIEDSEED